MGYVHASFLFSVRKPVDLAQFCFGRLRTLLYQKLSCRRKCTERKHNLNWRNFVHSVPVLGGFEFYLLEFVSLRYLD